MVKRPKKCVPKTLSARRKNTGGINMATFRNQATLAYNGQTTQSNVAVGDIISSLTVTKTAVANSYRVGDKVTYVVTLKNAGTTALTGLTLTDNLGGYTVGTGTVYPLTYTAGSLLYYNNGTATTAPTVTTAPALTITGITVPAGGNATLIYETTVNRFAPPTSGGTVNNIVTVRGTGVTTPAEATETITASAAPNLVITKSVSPSSVTENGILTFTFNIENYGNTASDTTANAILTDTFDPVLSNLTATYNGTAWVLNTDYTYNTATGEFASLAGKITVPAAAFTQDTTTGAWTVVPGTATVVISGTV